MIRFKHHPIAIAFVLVFALGFPQKGAIHLRSVAIASVFPAWSGVDTAFSALFSKLFAFRYVDSPEKIVQRESRLEKLEQENCSLLRQLGCVRDWLLCEERLEKEVEQLSMVTTAAVDDPFFERRRLSLLHRIDSELHAIPAKIIFREPATWSQMVWIDVGEEDNGNLALPVVQKDSPILVGDGLVGVIERVGKRRSLVRLITDPTLNVAVRVVRGREKDRLVASGVDYLIGLLVHEPRFEKKVRELEIFKDQLEISQKDSILAKGILHGFSFPLGRAYTHHLKGEGFNYDYSDAEGPARNLRTGNPYHSNSRDEPVSLIETGDLLETSGLDSLFPEGLRVAMVERVEPLNEGAVSYEIEAKSIIPSLDQMKHVLVIPPIRGRECVQ
jgi:rod shape-determining protein MreC